WCKDVIVHRVTGRAINPPAAARLLQLKPGARALCVVVHQARAVWWRIGVAACEHEPVRLADTVPHNWAACFGLDRLTDAYRLRGSVDDISNTYGRVFKENTGNGKAPRVTRRKRIGCSRVQWVVMDSAVTLQFGAIKVGWAKKAL